MKSVLKVILKRKLIFVVIALFIISIIIDKSYVKSFNINALLADISIIGLLALGEMIAIISGGIDLSVGNMASASSVFTAFMMIQLEPVVPPWANLIISIAFALVFCMALGLLNGISIAILGLPPLIATLGGMWISKGFAYFFLNGMATSFKVKEFTILSRGGIGPVPYGFILLLIITAIVHYVLKNKRSGRAVYSIGGNEFSARLSGIKVKKVTIGVYIVSALLAGIGGLVLGAYTGTGYVKGANGYELYAIAAVVIGGVVMTGGSGDTWNALFGVFVFRMIKKMMVYANLSDQLEGLYLGILLLFALALSTGTFKEIRNLRIFRKNKAIDKPNE